MSSPESSPEGTPKGTSPHSARYSPSTSPQLPGWLFGEASTSSQIQAESRESTPQAGSSHTGSISAGPKGSQAIFSEDDFEDNSTSDSSSEESPPQENPLQVFQRLIQTSLQLPLDVRQHYRGPLSGPLVQAGIVHEDAMSAFLCAGSEKFIFIKMIGRGTYAFICKAVKYKDWKTDLEEEVAIKVVKPITSVDRNAGFTELQILEKLIHRPHINVLSYLYCFRNTSKSGHYIVSELSPLGDLYQVLCQYNSEMVLIWQPLKPQYCRHIIQGIASGVQHLFSLGVSHADVKAENVLIFWDNRPAKPNEDYRLGRYMRMVPKLIDFNNSEKREPGGPIMIVGPRCSPTMAAPETWFMGNTPYDGKKADVYSVGALLLSMLLGCKAFSPSLNFPPNHQMREIINMKKSRNFVNQLVRPFQPRLKQLLLKTLEPLPQNRITIEEFLSDDWFTQRIESQEREERRESTLWRGLPQRRAATPGHLKSY